MAKFYGAIGYVHSTETSPGVYTPRTIVRHYYGDLLRNSRRLEGTDKVNSDINISNEISIVADPYANQHFHEMRYAEFQGVKWRVTNVTVQNPRLILTLGGVYNGE